MDIPEAGWYDDPWSPSQYRYWNGSMWTPHVAPRQQASQPAEHPTGQQVGQQPGQLPPQQAALPMTGPAPYTGYGAAPSTMGMADPWRPKSGPTTPDGVPMASRWARLGGRLLDNLFVGVAALPFNFYFLVKYNAAAADWRDELDRKAANGQTPNPFSFSDEMLTWLVPILLVSIIVGVIYEVLFLRRSGATPGKHIVGAKVRRYDDPQSPPPMSAIARRCAFVYGLQALYVVPVLFVIAAFVILLDDAWLLWDRKRQTLHDKVAGTAVVKSR